ncbi:MAG: hypothetical protein QOF20_306 [Acidimicrobiaceae bacterium]|nr:hypothetical protein [Acidimicrobiaceae bacterium]
MGATSSPPWRNDPSWVPVGAATDQRFYESELYRFRGELLATCYPHRVAEAKESLRRALAVARGQGALALVARAEATLAALCQSTEPVAGYQISGAAGGRESMPEPEGQVRA